MQLNNLVKNKRKRLWEVLEKGNFMPSVDADFYRIFYDGHLYIMTIKYMGIIKHYSCDMKIKLIKN